MNSLGYIVHRIGDKRVLTRDEVKELAIRYKAGDNKAGLTIIEHNIRLVINISRYYVNKYGFEFDDIIGYGIIGMYNALRKFDPYKGFTFATYSNRWIRQTIARHMMFRRDVVNRKEHYFVIKSIDDETHWRDKFNCISYKDEKRSVFLREKLLEYIEDLDERTKEIMKMKFGFYEDKGEMTLRAIGKEVNLTAERVRQIIAKQLRSMRRTKRIKALR